MKAEINLDIINAKYGWNIAHKTKDDTLINKALGVLQEQGVYMFFLFLESRGSSDKKNAEEIRNDCWKMLGEINSSMKQKSWDQSWSTTLKDNLLNQLDNLLFATQMLEQTLIYARYHAKSIKKGVKIDH